MAGSSSASTVALGLSTVGSLLCAAPGPFSPLRGVDIPEWGDFPRLPVVTVVCLYLLTMIQECEIGSESCTIIGPPNLDGSCNGINLAR